MRGLKDKTAIVTGGLGELGYASAARLVEEGCKVAIFDIKADEAKANRIGCRSWQVDITNEDSVKTTCEQVRQSLGNVTILVNAAARFVFKGLEATLEDFRKNFDVNVAGMSLVTKHVVPMMQAAGGGAVVNFASISAHVGQPGFATYNSSKFATRGLTTCWAQDLAPLGIRVNSISPGYFYTEAFVDSCKQTGRDLDMENKRVSAMHILGRQGRPESEIGGAVAFLASSDASFMTGSDLLVDGGYLAR